MKRSKRTPLRPVTTYVYFLQCNGAEGPVKIGFSSNVEERLADLQVGSPYQITLLGFFKCSNPRVFERSLHRLFRDLRIRGEWYRFSPEYGRLIRGMREIEQIAGDRTVNIVITRQPL